MICKFSLSILLLSTLNLLSQIKDTVSLKEILITANRQAVLVNKSPEIVRIINSDDIKSLMLKSTGDIIEHAGGVSIETGTGSGYPKRSTLSINGFPANYNLVLVNGIRLLTDHVHTGQNIDLIPTKSIESIEIIEGASSAQYGSDAMGGLVNIITKKSSGTPHTNMSTSFGSNNYSNANINVNTPVTKDFGIVTTGSWEKSSGQDIITPINRSGYMGYEIINFISDIDYKITDITNITGNNLLSQNKNIKKDSPGLYSQLFISGLGLSTKAAQLLEINTNLKFSKWTAQQNNELNLLLSPELFFRYQLLENNSIMFGGDIKYSDFRRTSVVHKNQNNLGVFIQDDWEFNKLILTTALRLDKPEIIDPVFTPKFALLYTPFSFLKLRGSYSKGFHAPSLMDKYEEGYGHSGTNAYRFGNINLKPEYSTTYELSEEIFITKDFLININSFYSTINNMITMVYQGEWKRDSKGNPIYKWQRINIAKAEIFGTEIYSKFKLSNQLDFNFGYTFSDNKNTVTNKQLPYYPGETFFSKLNYKNHFSNILEFDSYISIRGAINRSAWNWKPTIYSNFDNPDGETIKLKDYNNLSFGASIIIYSKFSLSFDADNILKQQIEKYDDAYTVFKGKTNYKFELGLYF